MYYRSITSELTYSTPQLLHSLLVCPQSYQTRQSGYATVSLPVQVNIHHNMRSHPLAPICTLLTCTCSSQSPECNTHTGYHSVVQSFPVRDRSQLRSWAGPEAAGMKVTWGQVTLQMTGLRLLAVCVGAATSIHYTTETLHKGQLRLQL